MKQLVLCADDFALNASVSHGIAELVRLGCLSATSAMVLSPRWSQDAALLREWHGRIDVGLHLDWTSAFAIDAGHGQPLGVAMRRALLGGFGRTGAREVIERQLDAFEAVWQAPPDHIDGHQHVQQFAGIREALVNVLQGRYAGGRSPYLRLSRAPVGQRDLKSRIIAALGSGALARLAVQAGIPCAPALSGIYDFRGGAVGYARHMARWLSGSPDGTLLMCHPARAAEAEDEIGPARVWEFDYLRSEAFVRALAQAQVSLSAGRHLYTPASEISSY